ncbi:hypothetical protein Pmani_027605 [Petrolisthes manimaculis]|uniref:SWIM-type domain-containing protein n=1 Tax=Petrolisthes manimaculis TaxID=1843537 RepID=A0AAE1P3D9_9EUCA|nr:hypothetical protein Pmani_027605 [Petrolisthes manimaculis]
MAVILDFDDEDFNNIIINNEKHLVQVKTNAFNDTEAWKWKEVFTKKNNVCFNVSKLYSGERYTYHQKFICINGDKRHKGTIKTCTGCNVTMDIKIKLITRHTCKKDKDVKTHPCMIIIEGEHNHHTQAASTLQQRVLPETKDNYIKYFNLGMSVPQAVRSHQEKMNLSRTDLTNCALNPSLRAVYHIRQMWMNEKHGTLDGESMFSAIEKYAAANPNSKIKYQFEGERFAIVLITEFMFRIHQEFREASEVVFVDTTSHLDQHNTAVTLLLCVGSAGALPLAVIFTSSQDEVSFTAGFQLLKKVLGEIGFFHKEHPDCFITDNNEAQQNGLGMVWPQSQQFLCIFHILRQVWRWLCDGSHGINKKDRPVLMKIAKQLVYASSESDFDYDWKSFCQTPEAKKYELYIRYLTTLIQRKAEWSTMYRAEFLLCGHQTNNFAESTVCIIKDIILNRCKASNPCQLIVFMNEVYDVYMKQCVLDVSLGRRKLMSPTEGSISKDNIIMSNYDEYQFIVKSQSGDKQYTVHLIIGMCDCRLGMTGKVCKHQLTCSEHFLLQLPQMFRNSPEYRQWLESIVYGKENKPSLDFIAYVQECPYEVSPDNDVNLMENENSPNISLDVKCEDNEVEDPLTTKPSIAVVEGIKELNDTLLHLATLYEDDQTVGGIQRLLSRFKSVRTSNELNNVLDSIGSAAVQGAGCGEIPSHPMNGMPQGAAPIGKGHKRKGSLLDEGVKQQRNLALNVILNQPYAKNHGSSHYNSIQDVSSDIATREQVM